LLLPKPGQEKEQLPKELRQVVLQPLWVALLELPLLRLLLEVVFFPPFPLL
jgi:hypothetical protein